MRQLRKNFEKEDVKRLRKKIIHKTLNVIHLKTNVLSFLKSNAFKKIFFLLMLFPFFMVSAWCVSFGFIAGFLGVLLLSIGAYKHRTFKMFLLMVGVWMLVNLVLFPNTINNYNKTTTNYFSRVQKGERLSFRENCNIYGMNLMMAAGAFIIYPEVAKETFLMIFPAKERAFENDFFMSSKAIQRALKDNPKSKKVHVSWRPSDYLDILSGEARVALALNACDINRHKNGAITAEVMVTYPVKAKTLLIPFPIKIYVEEGLFHYLQNIGWLHSYKAVYWN